MENRIGLVIFGLIEVGLIQTKKAAILGLNGSKGLSGFMIFALFSEITDSKDVAKSAFSKPRIAAKKDSDSLNHGEHGGRGENQAHQSPRDPRDPRG